MLPKQSTERKIELKTKLKTSVSELLEAFTGLVCVTLESSKSACLCVCVFERIAFFFSYFDECYKHMDSRNAMKFKHE